MTDRILEAANRLPSLDALNQVMALLNMPPLDEADRNADAEPARQRGALLTKIENWVSVAAIAARDLGELASPFTNQYAYAVETVDEHSSQWWQLGDDGPEGGVEDSPDSAETFALTVLIRYLDHIHDHRDDYDQLFYDELHVRVSVWSVNKVVASWSAPKPADYPSAIYWRALKVAKIAPDAVEIRTPSQVWAHSGTEPVKAPSARQHPLHCPEDRPS